MNIDPRVRAGVFCLLAVAALVVTFAVGSGAHATTPKAVSASGDETRAAVVAALADYDTNERSASSAPQQTVVGGWVARDLLEAIAKAEATSLDAAVQVANREQPAPTPDRRIPILVALAVLAICWLGVTSRNVAVAMRAVASTDEIEGDAP